MNVLSNITIDPTQIQAFCEKWGLREFSLFGSVLRDGFGPDSDIDVLIAFLPGHAMTLESFIDMKDELETLFRRRVDLVEKRLVRNPFRRYEILTTRKILYTTKQLKPAP